MHYRTKNLHETVKTLSNQQKVHPLSEYEVSDNHRKVNSSIS